MYGSYKISNGVKKLGMLLWLLAALAYIGGLVSLAWGSDFLGVHYMTWYWNALVAGVLAVGVKLGVLIMMKEEKKA